MGITLKIIINGFLFLITIGTGILLSRSGKPLNKLIFNIHKLIALVSVIFLITLFYNLYRSFEVNFILLFLIIIMGLFILSVFITGVLLSFDKTENKFILGAHNIVSFITLIIIIIMFFLYK